MKNLLVTMSGGTTTVINSTLAGIISKNKEIKLFNKIYAGIPGIDGVFKKKFLEINSVTEKQLDMMRVTPGSALTGTTRINLLDIEQLEIFKLILEENSITSFINIGGNGTIKQTKSISKFFNNSLQVAAVPKTVDNDLGDMDCSSIFFTPGFPSCVNHWSKLATLLDIENQGSCSHDKVLVAQTFGRETGFLAGATRIADPERKLPFVILIPEDIQPVDKILQKIDNNLKKYGRTIVFISEGYDLGFIGNIKDSSGQIMYGSNKTTAAQLLVDKLLENNIQARSFIPTVLQRQAINDTLIFDRDVAFKLGEQTVSQFALGNSNFLTTIKKDKNCQLDQSIGYIPFRDFDNFSRVLKNEFIAKESFDVSDLYIQYLHDILKLSYKNSEYYGYSDSIFLRNLE